MSDPTKLEQDENPVDNSGNVPGTGLLNKSLDILQYVGETERRLKFKDLSARTGFSKSTLYRILSALSSRGFIATDRRDQSYILGPKFTALAGSISRSSELIAVSSAILKSIADTYGENVNLGVMNGDFQQATARWEGRGAREFASALGEKKQLYCTGLGKALLAFQPELEQDRLIAQIEFSRYTPNTIMNAADLRAEMRTIQARGFAIDDNEIIEGVRCVSVPIYDAGGDAIASISITGPAYRMIDERLYELASVLQSASRTISEQLRASAASRLTRNVGNFAGRPITVYDVQSFEVRSMLFDDDEGRLFWVDPAGACVRRLTGSDSEVVSWFEGPVYGLCFNAARDALLTVSGGALWRVVPSGDDTPASKLMEADVLENARHLHQTPSGMLILAVKGQEGNGSLFSLDAEGNSQLLASDIAVRAGIATGNGGHVLHALCAQSGRLLSIDCTDPRSPPAYSELPLSERPTEIGGLAIDSDGDVWLSHTNRWLVSCHAADGTLRFSAPLPVPAPSAMAVKGTSDTILIGSDRIALSPNVLELAPLSGGILKLKKPAA
ncbi:MULTISPECIES: IclR family transcriptional regulator domain-containing protein [Agrobacterium]|uniref:IclR family transcriptional regulator domain-containing protein n=1 Tax=Agrobacterium tumefaciens TaxID=358 RepID=UPI000EF288E4|nr:hypothetical protein At1D1108_51430 [Agrobacterium tumefaciens]NSY09882.1 helix-turn-helix domain-containing protein [Agrobacterium tumefaciens]NSY93426.1 helix-turn-helix domain-containing protein [Agrobacterium tumefaciens]